jgi:hypothetical protein
LVGSYNGAARKFDFKKQEAAGKVNFRIAPGAGKRKFELKSQIYGHPSLGRKQLIAAATPSRKIDFRRNL